MARVAGCDGEHEHGVKEMAVKLRVVLVGSEKARSGENGCGGEERGKESEQWGREASGSGSASTKREEEARHAAGGGGARLAWLPRPGQASAF